MGNCCTRCIRKSDTNHPMHEDYLTNYGSAGLNSSDFMGRTQTNFQTGYLKDGTTIYRPLSNENDINGIHDHVRAHNYMVGSAGNAVGDAFQNRARAAPIPGNYNRTPGYVVMPEPPNMMLSSIYTQSSTSNLQHISEREPDDTEADPSLNPTKETLFMQRSIRDVETSVRKRRSIYDRNVSRNRQRCVPLLHRSSSTSTIWLDDSTVTRPDPKSTVRALAQAVYLQIKNRDRQCPVTDIPEIFDECVHPIQNEPVSYDYRTRDPDQKTVYRFIRTLFQMAQLSPECAIVTMVYLERLLTSAETELTPATWKRIVLCAILLASKVWDDQAVWNVDYCQILKDMNVNDVNELERQFLEIIQFNINVPSSVYAKYYFDIRSLCASICHPFPLSNERAYKLEAYSRILDDPFYDIVHHCLTSRRWGSLDTLSSASRFRPAIIS